MSPADSRSQLPPIHSFQTRNKGALWAPSRSVWAGWEGPSSGTGTDFPTRQPCNAFQISPQVQPCEGPAMPRAQPPAQGPARTAAISPIPASPPHCPHPSHSGTDQRQLLIAQVSPCLQVESAFPWLAEGVGWDGVRWDRLEWHGMGMARIVRSGWHCFAQPQAGSLFVLAATCSAQPWGLESICLARSSVFPAGLEQHRVAGSRSGPPCHLLSVYFLTLKYHLSDKRSPVWEGRGHFPAHREKTQP